MKYIEIIESTSRRKSINQPNVEFPICLAHPRGSRSHAEAEAMPMSPEIRGPRVLKSVSPKEALALAKALVSGALGQKDRVPQETQVWLKEKCLPATCGFT